MRKKKPEMPEVVFAVMFQRTKYGIAPILLKHKKNSAYWVSDKGKKYTDVAWDVLCATPQDAINHYLACQRHYLEEQSDNMAGTHYIKEPENVSDCK